jgi:DNA-binding transcriptional regulator PaaX
VCFPGEELSAEEIENEAANLRQRLNAERKYQENVAQVRRQIGAILLAAHPERVTKDQLLTYGIDEYLLRKAVGQLEDGGWITGGNYSYKGIGLTDKGLEKAKAAIPEKAVA